MDLGAASVASTSIFQQTPIAAGSATSDIKPVSIPKQELRTLLDIDKALAGSQSKSLCLAFVKYTACLAAVQLYEYTVAQGKWPSKYEKVTYRNQAAFCLQVCLACTICALFSGHYQIWGNAGMA